MKKWFIAFLTVCLIFLVLKPYRILGDTYYFDVQSANKNLTLFNAGEGYEKQNKINKKDLHYGWNLGKFEVSGFSSKTDGDIPVFYKTTGDNLVLKFNLLQNIDKLNKKEMHIIEDKKGQDVLFETEKTNFGKGALIIKYTATNNNSESPKIYTDFLTGKSKNAKNMSVTLNEEGTYEIALDYRIKKDGMKVFKKVITWDSEKYRMSFKFKVLNAKAMGYLFDLKSNSELSNNAIANDGFRIDLANSKTLKAEVRREIWNDGEWDSKGVEPAYDGKKYTKNGKYTITFSNEATSESVTKIIYVNEKKHS